MRIEYQGHVEVQPPYQHVGYVAAALMGDAMPGRTAFPTLAFGSSLLLVLLAAMVVRRRRTAIAMAGAIVVAALGIATCVAAYQHNRARAANTAMPHTLYQIERLSALTEDWIAQHHRAPTEAEWEALVPLSERVDGWGNPLLYVQLTSQDRFALDLAQPGDLLGLAKTMGYAVLCERDGIQGIGLKDFDTWRLGVDGLAGTEDDEGSLRHLFRTGLLDARRLAHGRAARKVAAPDAH